MSLPTMRNEILSALKLLTHSGSQGTIYLEYDDSATTIGDLQDIVAHTPLPPGFGVDGVFVEEIGGGMGYIEVTLTSAEDDEERTICAHAKW